MTSENFRKYTPAKGYHKRAFIIHLVDVSSWTALVTVELQIEIKGFQMKNVGSRTSRKLV